MASPRLSVIAVVVGVLAAAGAGAYYFFAVFSSDERLREARAQVEAWEKEWVELRQCVLGQHPMADTFEDAIAGRELSQGSAEAAMGDCTKLIGRLTRPSGNATGIDGVEDAWLQIDQLASELAQRYVQHLQDPIGDVGEKSFAAGLQEMAKARVQLRTQVELTPTDGAMGPEPRALVVAELSVDGQKLTQLDVAAPTASGELLGRAAGERDWMAVKIKKGATGPIVEGRPLKNDVLAPLPTSAGGLGSVSWGVVPSFVGSGDAPKIKLSAGALDAAGAVAPPGVEIATGLSLRPGAALGEGQGRAVIFSEGELMKAAVSDNGGASWKKGAFAPFFDTYLLLGDGFVDVLSMDPVNDKAPQRHISLRRIAADKLPVIPSALGGLDGYELKSACGAPGGPWVIAEAQGSGGDAPALNLFRFEPAKLSSERPELDAFSPMAMADRNANEFVECDDGAALLSTGAGGPLWSCRQGKESCTRFPWQASSGLGTVVKGAPLVVTVRKQLMAVLTEENPPLLVRLPADSKLVALHDLGGTPLLVLQGKGDVLSAATLPVK